VSLAGLLAPPYDGGTLASVLPAVAASLGSTRYAGEHPFDLREARRAVVVLVDGLGYELLRQRSGHAPFLRSHLPAARRIECGFPTTTATSMGSFGTGLPPGAHGLVGYEVLVPGEDRLLNELSWENGPDPFRWQPSRTVFEEVQAEVLAKRFFDDFTVASTGAGGADLHRPQDVLVYRERGSRLCHLSILAS